MNKKINHSINYRSTNGNLLVSYNKEGSPLKAFRHGNTDIQARKILSKQGKSPIVVSCFLDATTFEQLLFSLLNEGKIRSINDA